MFFRIVILLMVMALSCPSVSSAEPASGDGEQQIWLIDDSPSFPGLRMIMLHKKEGRYEGSVTSDWYGVLPLLDLHVNGQDITFRLDNGNKAVSPTPVWHVNIHGTRAHIHGKIWYQNIDLDMRRGTGAEASLRHFPLVSSPAFTPVPSAGLARTPPMGWSSWNRFGDKIDDATIRQQADALVSSGLRDLGYIYVNIDDGWQGNRDASGIIHPNARFPDMKLLADYVHSKGLKLGLYSSPGPKTCAGYAGSYGHVEQDAKTYADWGVDYLKYDLCSGEAFYRDMDSIRRAYAQMGHALRATGRPIVYSLCEYGREHVGQWGTSVGGQLWRTTGDIEDRYQSMAVNGFDKNGDPADVKAGSWNDPDMLEVGNGGMTDAEYRTHFSLWALSAAPLLTGNDITKLTEETKNILGNENVISIDQDILAAPGQRLRRRGDIEIWRKTLADGVALGVFNRGHMMREVDLKDADYGVGHPRIITDLWSHQTIAPEKRHFRVEGHGVVLLKIVSDHANVR
ncbi:MAG: glycoside hydrolase family 27 protein [Acetobacter sp.]|jgi:alpha-galactosidase|nr:glycoside hydrolase family 27 protein [Acetobacter sp.]MCH4061705.1 glycoside hydrolase family 27 protein [Acetobacter sp.]MCH4089446.1 glycoside hydrolase family 27 protein [Acetobacter sp.]MCI1293818.1 glycoside hydrolase family 27 protein [Acetobacter sp.]MCI1320402.1 glycoside hydrolase family 27 protein [Acetobacter sp.]